MPTTILPCALVALTFASACATAATIDIATNSASWTVSVPSQGISNATPYTGYIANSIAPFSGGNCTVSTCYETFDGFWTATLNFTLPSNATGVALDFTNLDADDRAVLELNGTIIGNAYTGGSTAETGTMTFTDGGTNETYNFGGTASESGDVTSGFDIGGSNTLTLIVNNTQGGYFGTPTGYGYTAAGVAGSVTYSTSGSGPVTGVPEPAPAFPLIAGFTAMLVLSQSRRSPGGTRHLRSMNRWCVGIAALAISVSSVRAASVTLYDATASPEDSSDSITKDGPLYASFSTPAGSAVYLSEVMAIIENRNSGTMPGAQITVALYADVSQHPGALLLTLGALPDASLPAADQAGTYSFPVNPAFQLAPGTRYWVGLTASNGSQAGLVWTDTSTGPGVATEYNIFDGQLYQNTAGPYQLKITAQATPPVGSMAHLASGAGWDTQLTLVNKGATTAQAMLSFFGDDGSALQLPFTFPQGILQPQTAASLTQSLSANQTLVLDTDDSTVPAGLTGSAQLTGSGVDGFEIFRYTPSGQEAVVPLDTRAAASYVLAFDNTGGVSTGVALASVSSSAAAVPVTIRNDAGAILATDTVNLNGDGHVSFELASNYPATAGQRGTVEFDAPAGATINVLGLRAAPIGNSGSFAVTTLPVLADTFAGGGSIAQVAAGGGWQTTFTLVNTNPSTAAQAQLSFYDNNGNPLPLPLAFPQTGANTTASTVNETIAGGASVIIVANDPKNADVGWARLTTAGSIDGFAIFQYTPTGQEAVVPLEPRNAASYLLAFDNTNGLSTGVALANISAQQATVSVTLRDDTGAVIGTDSIVLPANAHTSFTLTDNYAATANKRGTVEFDGTAAEQISVLGLRAAPTGTGGAFAVTTIPVLVKPPAAGS